MPDEVVYEMGYRAGEFANVLCGSFSGDKSSFESTPMATNHWKVTHKESNFSVDLIVSEQADREIGMFRIPVIKVCFKIEDDCGDVRAQFFKRFHQYFHKGGG
jgi:hypothetical protein